MMRSTRRVTFVMLMIALGAATAAFAQDAPSTPMFRMPAPNLEIWRPQQARPFDRFKQWPPAIAQPPAAALVPPVQDFRIPSLIPYATGIARTPSTVCAARVIPMDKRVDPGAVVAPWPRRMPGATRLPILGAEGTCAPNPRAVAAPK
jgi:hypothetical protein